MADGPEWFAPKRYGYGAGAPITWQGWALLAAYVLAVIVSLWAFGERPATVAAILVPATLLLMVISARTTRGGWRWRWGDVKQEDERRSRSSRNGTHRRRNR